MNEAEKLYTLALEEMKGVNPNIKNVLNNLNQAYNLGSMDACYALATWFLHGTHVKKDMKKAISLLKISAAKKHSDALYDLAVCYEEGKGIEKDERKAFLSYLEAALYGDDQSNYEVGRCYYYGVGIIEDKQIAGVWLDKAESLGIEE
jgi:TPR repeat protein